MPKTALDPSPFDPSAPVAPPGVNSQELVARLAKLQQHVTAAVSERAVAEARLDQSKKDLATIDDQLKKLNVDPETAEEALKQLELELTSLTAQYEQQVEAERKAYAEILAATQ